MKIEDLELRKLDLQDLKTLVEWAKKEGWNPGAYDAEIYWATDPNGFYGYYFKEVLVAGGAIVSYNNEFGFMGLFIVKPEFRGNGWGRKLWYQRLHLLTERLNEGATIGMDGVVAMQPFYQKGGFKTCFKDERYEKIGIAFDLDSNISNIKNEDLPQILSYDEQCFGFSRPQFLSPWIKLAENKNFKYLENDQLKGFAIVRKVANGFKIGPLFADNIKVAEELYKACLNSVIGEALYIDIPMANQEAVQMVKNYHAKYVFECSRMYKGNPPQVAMNKVYGITSFELG